MANDTNWGVVKSHSEGPIVWYDPAKATAEEIAAALKKAEELKAPGIDTKPSNPKDLIGTNKLPLDLVPAVTKAYLALGHLEGSLKYGLVNWREAGVKVSIYVAALNRHVDKYMGGEWEDADTHVPHLANALTCLSIIVDAFECGKLVDDRPKQAPVSAVIDRFGDVVKYLREKFKNARPVDYLHGGPKQREG